MKVYFAWSIRGWRDDKELYNLIIEYISEYAEVLTEHIGEMTLSELGEERVTDEYIYTRDVSWIDEADMIIAEVTNPSHWVGYEIWYAEARWIPVYCLFRNKDNKRVSAMISGNKKLEVLNYKTYGSELKNLINKIFTNVSMN